MLRVTPCTRTVLDNPGSTGSGSSERLAETHGQLRRLRICVDMTHPLLAVAATVQKVS